MGREYSVPVQERQRENSIEAHLQYDNTADPKILSIATYGFVANDKTVLVIGTAVVVIDQC
jgi:hypothetical protein